LQHGRGRAHRDHRIVAIEHQLERRAWLQAGNGHPKIAERTVAVAVACGGGAAAGIRGRACATAARAVGRISGAGAYEGVAATSTRAQRD
jgi:hypothetical protein